MTSFPFGHMQAGSGDTEPALILARHQRLTVTDLYVKLRLPLGRIVALNGCESGLLPHKVGNRVSQAQPSAGPPAGCAKTSVTPTDSSAWSRNSSLSRNPPSNRAGIR